MGKIVRNKNEMLREKISDFLIHVPNTENSERMSKKF